MIYKLKLKNPVLTPYPYIEDLRSERFDLDTEYKFKDGLNILIGENGCGKTTLINLLRSYTLCKKSYYSKLPERLISLDIIDSAGEHGLLDGCEVHFNIAASTYNLRDSSMLSNDDIVSNIENFAESLHTTTISKGEGNIHNLNILLGHMFDEDKRDGTIGFPLMDIREKIKNKTTSSSWQKWLTELHDYYLKFYISDKKVTLLMDEPEQNLDIHNLESIYKLLTINRPDTQIIASLHNPLLIYKLSELDHVNIIELSKDYLKAIKHFVGKGDQIVNKKY